MLQLRWAMLIALFAAIGPGCGPGGSTDSGMTTDAGMTGDDGSPDTHDAMMPPVDGGNDTDTGVVTDAGPDSPMMGGTCDINANPTCSPASSYTSCACDNSVYAYPCGLYPTMCSGGGNTCSMGAGTSGPINQCGYNLPRTGEGSVYQPFANWSACMNMINADCWSINGRTVEMDVYPTMLVNGQLMLNGITSLLTSPPELSVTLSGDRGWSGWSNMTDGTIGGHCWVQFDTGCVSVDLHCYDPGVDPRVTPGAPESSGYPLHGIRLHDRTGSGC